MASLTAALTPISETGCINLKLDARQLNSIGFLKNLAFSNTGSSYHELKTRKYSNFATKCSSGVHVSHGVESTSVYDVPLLSCEQAIERLKSVRQSYESKYQYLAMYSSIFGGITTDPSAMVIPLDDHMVHRGHGVFDTAAISNGNGKYKAPFDRERIRTILIQTVSASKCRNGSLRYWLSAGIGDFQLSPAGCHGSSLYAVVIQSKSTSSFTTQNGGKVITSSIPIKPPQFAIMKSVNYLPNVLSMIEAEESDACAAIWLDEDGYIAEGPNMNVAFVTKEKELLMPKFDKILSGCTAKRVVVLAEELVKEGRLQRVSVRDVTIEEGKNAEEMMLIGSGVLVRPIIQWDNELIGNGEAGVITCSLRDLLLEDMQTGPESVRVIVPYV